MAPSNFGPAPPPPAAPTPAPGSPSGPEPPENEEVLVTPPPEPSIEVSMAAALESLRKTRIEARDNAKKSRGAVKFAGASDSNLFLKTKRFPRAAGG